MSETCVRPAAPPEGFASLMLKQRDRFSAFALRPSAVEREEARGEAGSAGCGAASSECCLGHRVCARLLQRPEQSGVP